MGTNYYRVKPIPKEDRDKLHEMLDGVLDSKEYKYNLEEEFERVLKENEVHICKMSLGWQVCFDHNWGKYYQPNRKSLEAFLSEPYTWIQDEYGKKYTCKEFWEKVRIHNENPKNNWTSESYREYEDSQGTGYRYYAPTPDMYKCKMIFGIDSHNESDFCVDGLRFAVFSDFS